MLLIWAVEVSCYSLEQLGYHVAHLGSWGLLLLTGAVGAITLFIGAVWGYHVTHWGNWGVMLLVGSV